MSLGSIARLSAFDPQVEALALRPQYGGAMVRRFVPPRNDILLALGVAALACTEIALNHQLRPVGAAVPTELTLAVALAWRRAFPLLVVAVVGIDLSLETTLGVPVSQPLVPLVGIVVSVYALSAHSSLERALVGYAVITVGGAVASRDNGIGNFLFGLLFITGTWSIGRIIRSRTEHAAFLEQKTERLESARAEELEAAAVAERARIARELHDVVAHSVSVMVVQAGAAEHVLRRDPDGALQALRSVQETGRDALAEMGRLLGILREQGPSVGFAPQPSLAELGDLIEQTRAAGLPVQLTVEGDPRPLSPGIELSLYRVVQEALTNARKHAGDGARADVVLRYTPREVAAEVSDDGRGSHNGYGGGLGLVGMRERVVVYGGSLETGSAPDGGYVVRVRIPVEDAP